MIILEEFDSHQTFVLVLLELLLPLSIKILKLLITDLNILSELVLLDVGSEFILVLINICLKYSNFTHQILIQCILLNIAEFLSKDLHFLLYE